VKLFSRKRRREGAKEKVVHSFVFPTEKASDLSPFPTKGTVPKNPLRRKAFLPSFTNHNFQHHN
jgi:hypothetical protein